MPTRTLRLQHAELCVGCADLLQTGTMVAVDQNNRVACLACARNVLSDTPATHTTPWPNADDIRRRDRLQHRFLLERRRGVRLSR
ncbi:MAG: hypothetical protein Q8K58_03010 [Acidimicrobiales bacterium]|nr:hypothetical protein [Acidimicrobiales bacterium]